MSDRTSQSVRALVVVLVLLGSGAAAAGPPEEKRDTGKPPSPPAPVRAAGPESKQAPQPPPGADDEATVITNEDLERMFGPAGPPPAPGEEPGGPDEQDGHSHPGEVLPEVRLPDPLKAMEDEKRRQAERQSQIATSEKDLAAAEARVRDLEKRMLEIRNPLLPRPKMDQEDAEAMQGLNSAERVQRTTDQLETARREVERIRGELARLRSGS